MRSRRRCSRCGWRPARGPLAGAAASRARRLVGGARRLCRRLGRPRLGSGRRLGRAVVPRLLPLRRPADGATPRARLAAAVRGVGSPWPALVYVGLAVGVAIAVPVHGDSATSIPAAQDHLDFFPARLVAIVGNIAGTAGRCRRGNCHDQTAPARKRARAGRRRCCRCRNRAIRLGSCADGEFLWQLQHFFFTEDLQLLRPNGTNQSLRSGSKR